MPDIQVNGARIHYEDRGSGDPCIVFGHGLLWDGRLFEPQVDALSGRYRCITFDFRGQGQSEVTESGYDMDTLCEDAAALIQALNVAPCHYVGLSMGGFVGQRLAIRHPALLRSLSLLDTSSEPEPPENLGKYRLLSFIARWFGLGLVTGQVMPILFGRKFLEDPARADLKKVLRKRLAANHRIGVTRAVGGVLEREGVSELLPQIQVPTLVVVGDQDVATVPEKSERIHQGISGSRFEIIPGAGHTSTLEEPEAVNRVLTEFLDQV